MSENPKLFALFIDGDNVQQMSIALVLQMLDKISEYGNPIIKNVYLNRASLTEVWGEIINEYSLHPIWVPNNTPRKNASDIALAIDAMELLCDHSDLTGFCIVSSDSDFTRLATHLVRKNKFVLGIGENKTPKSFVKACTKFIYIEDLLQPQIPVEKPKSIPVQEKEKPSDTDTNPTFETLFIQAYENTSKDTDGWVQLIEIKEGMIALDNEFQSSEYQNTRRFAEKIEAIAESYPKSVIEIRIGEMPDNKQVIHHICVPDCEVFKFIEAYKQAPVRERDGWVMLSIIGEKLKKYPAYENGFSYRGIRNKRLSRVVNEMLKDYHKIIEIKEEDDGNSVIHFIRLKE
jgi:uncharacterized protein (TIGR00288 family)